MTGGHARAAVACVLALAGATRTAAATGAGSPPAGARVRVVRAEGADPIMLEISNRTRAELTAAGLEAAIVDCAGGDARCAEARPSADAAREAVVSTARAGAETITEVKVAATTAAPLVLRLIVGGDSPDRDDPATLAVRASELVQSALLQAGASPAEASVPAPAAAPDTIAYDFEQPHDQPAAVGGTGWFAGGGGALLGSADGFGTAVGLMLRGGYSGLGWPALSVAVMVAAPALASELNFEEGRVAVRQDVGAVQASIRFRLQSALQPRLTVGAGAYHLNARGYPGSTAYAGRTVDLWAPMASVGAGAALRLSDALALFSDVQAVLAFGYPEVRGSWQKVSAAHPSVLVSSGIEWLF